MPIHRDFIRHATCVLTALLVCVLHIAPTYAQSPSRDAIATAIAEELDALMSPEPPSIQGARLALVGRLHEFYARRSFRPAWSDRNAADQLLKAIDDSYDDGLDPADYFASELKALAEETRHVDAPVVAYAQLDVLMTEALLRLCYHLAFGKVDPESFDPQWNYARTMAAINLADEVERAIDSGALYDRVQALKPTHGLYQRTRRELLRYRTLGATELPQIASGASIRPGDNDARVLALRARLKQVGDLPDSVPIDSPHYDSDVERAVMTFQQRVGLTGDGIAGKTTVAELNAPIAQRVRQLRISLDRGRVLLHDLPGEFVVVNVAGYSIAMIRGEDTIWSARAQVGQPYRQTPIFRSTLTYLVLNPTWTVPPGIIEKDILPEARKSVSAITRRNLKVIDRRGSEIDPATIDWSKFKSGHIPYTLRQEPGPTNALGRVKFMFPNSYQVYLHDTPSKNLFERAERSFSSGCVRVERAAELAELLLRDQAGWDRAAIGKSLERGQLQNVTLAKKMPVLLTYWTAWVDTENRVNFRHDIYGQDALWSAGLDAPFKVRARPLFAPK